LGNLIAIHHVSYVTDDYFKQLFNIRYEEREAYTI